MDDIAAAAKEVLSFAAPTIATALGGPLAGTAASFILDQLGLAPDTPNDKVHEVIAKATPETLAGLKTAEAEFRLAMRKLDIDVETLQQKDRADARAREIAVRDRVPAVLAITMTLGFFGLLAWLIGHEPPAGSRDVLNILLGSFGTGWAGAMSYYFGSSSGSAAKDSTIKAAMAER